VHNRAHHHIGDGGPETELDGVNGNEQQHDHAK
jgi:hypothetical protein